MSAFDVTITDNQASPVSWNLKHEVVGWSHTTAIPGGGLSASFKVYAPTFIPPLYLRQFYNVTAAYERGIFWAGRIESLNSSQDREGEYWAVGCVGWGVHLDDQIDVSEDVSSTATNTVVANAVTNFTQKIDVQTISTTSWTLGAGITALKMMTPAQIIAQMMAFGDTSNNAQQWHVYPQDDGDIEFTFEDRPAATGYTARASQFEHKQFGSIGSRLANRVIVQYANATKTVTVNDTTLQGAGPAGWGFIKAIKLIYNEIPDSAAGDADALQIATVALALAGVERMAAKSLVARNNVDFRNSDGHDVPLHRIRSGKILELEDLMGRSTGGSNALTFDRSCLIVGTTYDEDTQTLSITPESYALTIEQQIARIYQVLDGRHTTGGSL